MSDDETTELGPTMYGRWLVTSASGTEHEWDIAPGQVRYRRRPAPGRGRFAYDSEIVTLTRIEQWPVVDTQGAYIFYDDPADPERIEQWRLSTPPVSIKRIDDPEPWDG